MTRSSIIMTDPHTPTCDAPRAPAPARLLLALTDGHDEAEPDPALLDEADRMRWQQHPVLASRPDWRSSRLLKQHCRPWLDRGCPWSLSHSHSHAVLALWLPPDIDSDPDCLSPQGIGPVMTTAAPGHGIGPVMNTAAPGIRTDGSPTAGMNTPAIGVISDLDADSHIGATLQVGNGTGEHASAVTTGGHAQARIGVDLERIRPRDLAALLPQFAHPDEIAWWHAQSDPAIAFYRLWTLKEALLKAGGLDFPADLRRVGLMCDAQIPAAPASAAMRTGHPRPHSALTHAPDHSAPRAAVTTQGLSLRSPAGHGWHGLSAVLDGQWLLACVWPAGTSRPELLWQPHGSGWPRQISAVHEHQ